MLIEFVTRISDVSQNEWNSLWQSPYPFIQHAFLQALESSESVAAETGWQPYHLLVRDDNKNLVAAMPLYLKSHSYGEYVFDWQWANAYEQNGMTYYPKLINAIPFTPSTGPRFVYQSVAAYEQLRDALVKLADTHNISGIHSLFPTLPIDNTVLLNRGYLRRVGCQYHWFNQGYASFGDFLSNFSSRKRKNLRKERDKVVSQGIQVERMLGPQLSQKDWQDFYSLYQRTYMKRSGHDGYLNQCFFESIGTGLADSIMMVRAYDNAQLVAAALYFFDDEVLYGRYWGAHADYDGLHFECCYYQGIEFAIENKLKRFDPGAQGEHKIQRGFTPILTQSYHWLCHVDFHRAIKNFLEEEEKHIIAYCDEARQLLPFKETVNLISPNILFDHPSTQEVCNE